jgi:hypothetical protein
VKRFHTVGGPGLPATRPASSFGRVSEPWRAYSEMYHSGWLSANDTALIYSYQQNHDSLMRCGVGGGGNIRNAFFSHTAYGTAYGLVAASMAEEFLLFLYAQSHQGCTRGTCVGHPAEYYYLLAYNYIYYIYIYICMSLTLAWFRCVSHLALRFAAAGPSGKRC